MGKKQEKRTDTFLDNLREKAAATKCNTTRYAIEAVADAYDATLNPPEKDDEDSE